MVVASIRSKNPGAMWGRTGKRPSADKFVATNAPIPKKWGSTKTEYLNDGFGQGNNIAYFDTFVDGICAQLDLWRTSANYRNKAFKDAIAVWSGGNSVESYISFVIKRVPGITRNTIMNDDFWRGPMGLAFLKAQAAHEAGGEYPAPAGDWAEAQRRYWASVQKATQVKAGSTAAAVIAGSGVAAQQAAAAGYNWGGVVAIVVLGLAVGGLIYVLWTAQKKEQVNAGTA